MKGGYRNVLAIYRNAKSGDNMICGSLIAARMPKVFQIKNIVLALQKQLGFRMRAAL